MDSAPRGPARLAGLAPALALALALLSGCSGSGGSRPSDANEWTCKDWKDAGLGHETGTGADAATALRQLGNEVDESGTVPGSVKDKKAAIEFYINQFCARNRQGRPGAQAVVRTRRAARRAAPAPVDEAGKNPPPDPSVGFGTPEPAPSTPPSEQPPPEQPPPDGQTEEPQQQPGGSGYRCEEADAPDRLAPGCQGELVPNR